MPSPNPNAVAAIRAKTPVGSPLNTAGWSQVPIALRESAQFSATIERMRFLQRIQDRVTTAIENVRRPNEGRDGGDGAYQTKEKFVAELQKIAREEGLDPRNDAATAGRTGGLQDPTSIRRLDLIWNTQIKKAQEFAKWKMDQDPDALAAFPAQEFIRVSLRKKKRTDWPARWKKAFGGRIPHGRYVALKTDPGWKKLNRFGVPWPPFDFGSGMGLRDISRRDAVKLGLLKEGERVEPIEESFNQELAASVTDLGPKMQSALKRAFGDQVEIVDGIARFTPRPSGPGGAFPPSVRPIIPQPRAPIVPTSVPAVPPLPSPPLVRPRPVAAPRPPGTSGVGDSVMLKFAQKKESARYQATIDAIDAVHDDGPLEPIPFDNKIMRRSTGTYYSGMQRAGSIGVKRGIGDEGELTLAHEVGHWLDHIGIESETKFASESDSSVAMRPLMRSIRASEAIKKISQGPVSSFRSYLLSGRETFARAYSQFIAEESGRPTMLQSLSSPGRSQWTSEDFAPIRAEFRKLFISLGWIR